jgi:O-antigen ligase
MTRRELTRWIVPCTLFAIPLVLAPGLLFFYDITPKLVILYCAVALALPFVRWRNLPATSSGRIFCALVAATFLSLAVSSIVSSRADLSVFGTSWRRFGVITQAAILLFALIAAVDLSSAAGRLQACLRASTLAALLVATYGVLQYFGWDPALDPRTYHVGSGVWTIVRPPGTLGYVTYFANYLVFGVFQSLALYRIDTQTWWRRIALCAIAFSSLAIILSGTRAALVALVVGGLILGLRESRRPSVRAASIAAAVCALAIVFYLSPLGLQLRSRMRWFREDPAGGARLYLWRDSVKLLGRHRLLGTGPETFSVEFPQVQSADLSRAFPESYHESAHNMFLDAGTAQGLPGLIILAACVLLGFRAARVSRPHTNALLSGFAAILICHQFSVFTVPTALTFWITLAMLVSNPQPAASRTVNLGVLPLSVVLILLAARMTVGDRHLAQARNALDASRFPQAATEYRAAQAFAIRSDLWFSRKSFAAALQAKTLPESVAATQQALTVGISATQTADDPCNAWMNLALIYAKLNNIERTGYCIRKAIAASPGWYKPHLALAQLLDANNHHDEAKKEWRMAEQLNPALTSRK